MRSGAKSNGDDEICSLFRAPYFSFLGRCFFFKAIDDG